MQIRKVKMKQYNEQKHLIVDARGLPIPRLCEFTILHLAGADKTQELSARHVLHIEKWATKHNVDLAHLVAETGFADMSLFQSFVRHLEQHSYDLDGAIPIRPEIVSPNYFNQRIEAAVLYFEFLGNKAISKRRNTDPLFREIPKMVDKLKKRLIALRRPKTKHHNAIVGLSLLQQATLYEILENTNDVNQLGWGKATRLRNKLILLLFLETGIRKGELLSLTTTNCYTTRLEIGMHPFILTQQNVEHEDPRQKIPHEKTVGRIIPISFALAALIDEYKQERKSLGDAARKSPYLFLSTRAPYHPLSVAMLDDVFKGIKQKIPELGDIHPHKMRHTFFENLDRLLSRSNINEARQKALKNMLGGWTYNSESSLVYEAGARMEECNRVLNLLHIDMEQNNALLR